MTTDSAHDSAQLTTDAFARKFLDGNPNALVPWYLMASYMYYCEDRSLISDQLYDDICTRLYLQWDHIEHIHKHLIDRCALEAGTGFYLKASDYPQRTINTARSILGGNGYEHTRPPKHGHKSVQGEELPNAFT